MNNLEVIYNVKSTPLSPSEGLTNSVHISFDAKSIEYHENPTTGHRTLTGRSTPISSSDPISFSLGSSSPDHIYSYLHDQLTSDYWLLCQDLAEEISVAATALGFGRNSFHLTIDVELNYETVVVEDEALSKRASLLRMVLLGQKELKSLKMETGPCSICLENLSGSKHGGVATRMTCSHVFHGCCLVEWLKRKNTCPLCRTVLHDL